MPNSLPANQRRRRPVSITQPSHAFFHFCEDTTGGREGILTAQPSPDAARLAATQGQGTAAIRAVAPLIAAFGRPNWVVVLPG